MAGDDKQAVLDSIRTAILQAQFAPRQRLIESDLCETFGASRFSVRTALHELASQGLVEFQPNRGARVREVSLAEAIEITEVRKMLEGLEAARAAQRATKAEASELRQIGRDMRTAVRRGELIQYSDLNVRLHATIRQMGAHQTAARLLLQLRDQTVRHQFSLSLVPGRPAVSLPQHEAIIEAIAARRPAEAEAAMHDHLQSVVEALHALPVAAQQMSAGPRTVAVLGLGEAGSLIAADLLAAGAVVRAFDPIVAASFPMVRCANDAEACAGADVVIALTSAHDAQETLRLSLPGLAAGGLYADLNTASPGLKQSLALIAASAGVEFVDVALMSPVPGSGLRTPMLASGPGANRFATVFAALGASVDVLEGPPGTAAARKLVRSVFYKGLAAAVIEALRAGRAAGCEDWLRDNIGNELAGMGPPTIDRLERGSVQHALRRIDEMVAASEMLDELGVTPRVARASQQWLEQLLAERESGGR